MAIRLPRALADLLDRLDRDRDPQISASTSPGLPVERPAAGEIYAYRTTPYFEFSDPIAEAYAAVKVLAVEGETIDFAILDGLWPQPPTLRQVSRRAILVERRWDQASAPCVYGTTIKGFDLASLADAVRIGVVPPSASEIRLARTAKRFTILANAAQDPEGERRWRTDRSAFLAETAQSEARDAAEHAARDARHKARRASLTWAAWAAEPIFDSWDQAPGSPAAAFAGTSRARILAAGQALQALDAKPRKSDARRVLKACVDGFNTAHDATGLIETIEREDIVLALEDLAFLAGHPSLIEEVDVWRTW